MTDDLVNLIQREIGRALGSRAHPRHGLCTSYDKKTHSVKVKYQPDGTESGWIPISSPAAGQAVSMVHGPTPGDGKETGDMAIIGFLDGDIENPVILGWQHSDKDPPPEVGSGETIMRHTPQEKDKNGKKKHKPVTMHINAKGAVSWTGNDQGMSHTTQENGPISMTTPEKGTITIDSKKGKTDIKGKEITAKGETIGVKGSKRVKIDGKPVRVSKLEADGIVTATGPIPPSSEEPEGQA